MFRLFLCFCVLCAHFFALDIEESLILRNDFVIDKAADKINEMVLELREKTGVKVYLSAIEKLDAGQSIGDFHRSIEQNLTAPFVLITMSSLNQKIRCTTSSDLEKILDCNDAIDDYILPIVVEPRKDISKQTQYSAGLLNGVAHITDTIAAKNGIKLESSIGSESKNSYNVLLTVILIMTALTIFALFRAKMMDRAAK